MIIACDTDEPVEGPKNQLLPVRQVKKRWRVGTVDLSGELSVKLLEVKIFDSIF